MHVFNCSAGVCIHVREQVRALKVVEQLCTNVFTDGALMAYNPCCCCCCYYFVQILVPFLLFCTKAQHVFDYSPGVFIHVRQQERP